MTAGARARAVRSNLGGPAQERIDGACVTPVRQEINARWPALAAAVLGREAQNGVWLDVGCGTGQGYDLLARAGLRGEYVGVDLAAAPEWEEQVGAGAPLARRFVACDVDDLPRAFGISTVDGATSISAFEHFPDDVAALVAVGRVLRPGAPLLLCVPASAGRLLWGLRHGFHWYAAEHLHRLAARAGMQVELIQPVGGLGSLALGLAWFVPAYAASKLVTFALVLRYGGRRREVRRRHPWTAHLVTDLQFAHCGTSRGRRWHQRVVRLVNRLDRRARSPASAWVAVLRNGAEAEDAGA